jgi:hypothetical protein
VSATTGPILALGAVTVINRSVFNGREMDWRIPIGTGLAMIGFSLAERVSPDGAEILAWTALLTTLLTRLDPHTPSPVESALSWWTQGKSGPPADRGGVAGGGGGGSERSKEV